MKTPIKTSEPAENAASTITFPRKSRKLNLALQGGGAHGAFGWGVLDKFLEDGRIDIEGISATSAGAMNAVVYAYGMMKGGKEEARATLERFWRAINVKGQSSSPMRQTPVDAWLRALGVKESLGYHAFDALTRMLSPYQFNPLNLNPLKDVLLETVDFAAMKDCTCVELRICATNVRSGKPKIFSNAMLSAEAILASACLPMLFRAVEIDGEHYWDGGYIGNPAIYPLIYDLNCRDILIVHINPIARPDVPTNSSEIHNRINEISFNSSLIREMRAIAFATKLLDDGWIKPEFSDRMKRLYIHAIRADEVMSKFTVASKFDTDWAFLTHLRDLGREAAAQWLDAHFDSIGSRSTVDIRADYL
ncbi:RssA Predicted esterase of the alpha-beta hydrolase superfamily [Rhabdaerophilaceae bacterium]